MRVGFVSDIHSNLEALVACLAELDRAGIDSLCCLGDTVGYGASANECLDLLRERADHFVLGNHDAAVVRLEESECFNGDARRAVEWTRSVLREDHRQFLANLPLTTLATPEVRLVHASPDCPDDWRYVIGVAQAARQFEHFAESLCFYGHTHLPTFFILDDHQVTQRPAPEYTLPAGARALVNVGSVGQPRDGDPRAACTWYDTEARTIRILRVHYDIDRVQERILGNALPRSGAERLAWGV